MTTKPDNVKIADALVTALKTAGFTEAVHAARAHARREDAATRKCTVLVATATYDAGARVDFDEVHTFYIVLQKACAATDTATFNAMLLDVQTLVRLWGKDGALRGAVLADAEYDSGPEHPTGAVYEDGHLQDHQLFSSIVAVRYGMYA